MTSEELYDMIRCGETSQVQFKQKFTSQKQVAEEMVAFANSEGGVILFGIEDKTGRILGLSYEDIQVASRDVGNAANEHVRPTIYIQTSVVSLEDKKILVVKVQRGKNKPYKDLSGNIWVKQGADKRRITENREILSLFQDAGEFYPDELGIDGTSADDLDSMALGRFFENVYHKTMKDFKVPQETLLRNIHITDAKGRLTAAGLLFFGEHPQWHKPVFVIKAVWFYGNSIAGTEYRDSRDIEGTIPEMFEQGMMWLKSCLRRTQNGQSFNSIGKLEIPETVLEELLQNALVHADLLKTAAIRLLVFDDRVEIINPGCVFGGHTLDEVKMGNSFARNPLMANFCAKTMTYRGLGSGIPRVLAEDSHVEFVDSKEGNQFTARIFRPVIDDKTDDKLPINTDNPTINPSSGDDTDDKLLVNTGNPTISSSSGDKTDDKISDRTIKQVLEFVSEHPNCKTAEISAAINLQVTQTKWYIYRLVEEGKIEPHGGNRNRTYSVVQ